MSPLLTRVVDDRIVLVVNRTSVLLRSAPSRDESIVSYHPTVLLASRLTIVIQELIHSFGNILMEAVHLLHIFVT